jgi:hypothetical protein
VTVIVSVFIKIAKSANLKKSKCAKFVLSLRRNRQIYFALETAQEIRGRHACERMVSAVANHRPFQQQRLRIRFPPLLRQTNQHHHIVAPEHLSVFFWTALRPGEGAVVL